MAGLLTWIFPGILYAGAACAAPVLIHLLLRPRPRRQAFPALRLLRLSHQSSVRRQRVGQVLLLLVRMLVVTLIVLAFARPTWRGTAFADRTRGPVAAVLCLDDSASMRYVADGRTRLDRAVELADRMVHDERLFPAGSSFCVLRSSGGNESAWTISRQTASQRLRARVSGIHDRTLDGVLRQAANALTTRASVPREVFILTDMTARAWSDQLAAGAPPLINCQAYVIDVGQTEDRNGAVTIGRASDTQAMASPFVAAAGRPHVLRCLVRAGDERIEGQLEFWLDGALHARSDPIAVEPRASAEASITLPPMTPGPHRGEVRLDRADNLAEDNVAYAAIEVRPRVAVAVMGPAAHAPAHTEVRRIAALLAPQSLPEDRRPFDVKIVTPEQLAAPQFDPNVRCLVLVEPPALTAAHADWLRAWCNGGGTALIVAGADLAIQGWSATALGARPVEIVEPQASVEIAAEHDDEGLSALSGRSVERYVRLAVENHAEVLARFSNGDAAIVRQRTGKGRVIWWAFSPRNDWSDLGVRAAALLVHLHHVVRLADPATQRVRNVFCDDLVESSAMHGASLFRVERVSPAGGANAARDVRPGADGRLRVPTDSAGLYRVSAVAGAKAAQETAASDDLTNYAVNLRPEETEGRRLADEQVVAAFGASQATVVRDPGELTASGVATSTDRALHGVALVLVLALLTLESGLARRAYRSAAT